MDRDSRLDRAAVLGSLGLIAINVATTARWANVPGAMRGWRWPFIAATIVCAAVPALRRWHADWRPPAWLSTTMCWTGCAMLAGAFLIDWFPPSTWRLIPFVDDWPPRYASTVEGLALLKRGAFGGWQWNLLGGYATSTDITQNLTAMGAIPMSIFGAPVGFHLLHLGLFLFVPALVYLDLRPSRLAAPAAGLVAWSACAFWWGMVRNGDSNSLAGVVGVLAVLATSRRAREQTRFGFALLVSALALTAYAHLGFLAYAIGLLGVEALYYADWRHAGRCATAIVLALIVSLPVTFEILRYPDQFNFNNVMYVKPQSIDWSLTARRIGYNVQILFSPHRWFSDTAKLFATIVLLAAWRRDGREGFYAWATIFAIGLTLLNVPEAGYVFVRPAHLPVVFAPVAIAWFVMTRAAGTLQAVSLVILAILTVPIARGGVPHEPSVAAFVPALVEHVRAADGAMVLLENNPHRQVVQPPERSEKTLYGTHYEALMPDATGKRLYAGYWDGFQFTPFRGEMLAAGAWQGHMLGDADRGAFMAELQRWGIRHLFIWSTNAKTVFAKWPGLHTASDDGVWRELVVNDTSAVVSSVVVERGSGDLIQRDSLGGVVRLSGVTEGERIVVRTHYHPAWQVWGPTRAVLPIDVNGQLGFLAPASGSYDVRLVYPSHRWLLVMSIALLAGVFGWSSRSRLRAGR